MWTKEILYISRSSCKEITDSIPLHEVHEVMTMDDESAKKEEFPSASAGSKSKIDSEASEVIASQDNPADSAQPVSARNGSMSFLTQARLTNVFLIKTDEMGFNSGRTYYISTRSNAEAAKCMQAIVAQLSALAKSARRRAEAKSQFQQSQEAVKTVLNSAFFQIVMAVLIMMVMALARCITLSCTASHRRHSRPPHRTSALSCGIPLPPYHPNPRQNFAVNAVEAQIVDLLTDTSVAATPIGSQLDQLDTSFTIIFTA